MTCDKPVPAIDAESEPYWTGAREGRLMVQRCGRTGRCFLYSRRLAPGGGDDAIRWIEAKGTGAVYSFTVCHAPAGPAFRDETPYVVACVELDEGARIVSNLATGDIDAVHIGQRVEVFFDKVSDDLTVPKFRPAG
ncbi:MAG: OB-fold domain-containing protein [Alphaproteobacteria bacterium]|nr:OB-fold domain-containing protein [Alphaproteobacteria bacterium]